MESTGFRITKIIDGLRNFAREGQNDPQTIVSLEEIMREALDLCRARFESRQIKLVIGSHFAAYRLICNRVQLSQVLINLFNNAFDAIEEQPGGDYWLHIETDAAETSGLMRLVISNSGPPIPPAIHAKIMEPFFTTKPLGKGTGLGLSISRGIVEQHGGRLLLDSKAAHPRFVLELPLA